MATDRRDRLIKKFVANTDPFGKLGHLTPGQRIQRGRSGKITEDDPRFDPKTMGNRRYRDKGFIRQA